MTQTTTMDRKANPSPPRNQDPDIVEVAPNLPAGLPKGLRNYWYPVLQSEELSAGKPVGFMALNEPLVAWRGATGNPCVVRDRCPHRSIKLSIGRVYDGNLQCILHGLQFNGEGRCIMVPWEEEQDDRKKLPAAIAYPARELGGYIWAYLGDTTRFPAPSLEDEVPEELTKPDEFIWFRLPTEIWNANWLLSIDGSDAFHAVVLHASSQAVTGKTWTGGKADHAEVPLHERRMKIVKTSHGIRGVSLDASGNPLHHGHFTVDVKGDRFVLPCLNTNPIMPAPGAAPYTSRLWQFAVDETRTQIARYAVWRARTAEDREKATRVFHDLAIPRLQKVSTEDAIAAEAQGDVVTARQNENLLSPDVDVVGVQTSNPERIRFADLGQQARRNLQRGAAVPPLIITAAGQPRSRQILNAKTQIRLMPLKLSMTCGPYDRAQALIDGSVKPDDVELDITVNDDDVDRQLRSARGEFDVCEFFTGTYIADLPFKKLGFTAIPIYVKRMFRHSYIYTNRKSGIRSPADLIGKRIGVQTWVTTAALWAKGILEEEYGVDLASITWVAWQPVRIPDWKAPEWLQLVYAPMGTAQFDLLAADAVDAAITTEIWAPGRHPDIDFLFPDYGKQERAYFQRTRCFPIMHTLLIRNSVLERDPWVARSIYDAWEASKRKLYERQEWERIHMTSLWYRALWEEERAAAGDDIYAWGFKQSRHELEIMLRYAYRQAFTPRQYTPEELFWPSMLDT